MFQHVTPIEPRPISMVVTDLDGTLLHDEYSAGKTNLAALRKLGEAGVCRVAATGRTNWGTRKVIGLDFPIDYVVFSAGVGIYHWKSQQLIFESRLEAPQVEKIAQMLITDNLNFNILNPAPENHYFYTFKGTTPYPDFVRRIERHKNFLLGEVTPRYRYKAASQILAIMPPDMQRFERLKNMTEGVKIIRSTSPTDEQSLWMEFFPHNVSKGLAIEWLCNYLQIPQQQTLAVGNDYNDLDMLHFAANSYVVSNAPNDLKQLFNVCPSNTDNGFAHLVQKHFNL